MARSRILTTLLLVLLALLVAGCGGDDDGNGGDDGGSDTTETTQTDDGGGDGGADGKALFTQACGSCHTLSDAGTTGAVGPNLDEAAPDEERVRTMIEQGGGGMPPNLLEGEEADAVAAYVADVTGE